MPNGSDVESFLQYACKLIDNLNRKIETHGSRRKNMISIVAVGMTFDDVYDEINQLTLNDYIAGPEDDRDRPGTGKICKFKKVLYNRLFYIKIKIDTSDENDILKVLSFHFDGL